MLYQNECTCDCDVSQVPYPTIGRTSRQPSIKISFQRREQLIIILLLPLMGLDLVVVQSY